MATNDTLPSVPHALSWRLTSGAKSLANRTRNSSLPSKAEPWIGDVHLPNGGIPDQQQVSIVQGIENLRFVASHGDPNCRVHLASRCSGRQTHAKCVAKVRVIRGLYAKVLCDALHHFERLLCDVKNSTYTKGIDLADPAWPLAPAKPLHLG